MVMAKLVPAQSSKHPNSYLSTMTVLTSLSVIVAVMLSSSSFLDGVAAFSFSSSSISSSRLSMMSGSGGRSPLAQQYKNVQSIRGGVLSGSSGHSRPRMAPPGEPEPEVRVERRIYTFSYGVCLCASPHTRSIDPNHHLPTRS